MFFGFEERVQELPFIPRETPLLPGADGHGILVPLKIGPRGQKESRYVVARTE